MIYENEIFATSDKTQFTLDIIIYGSIYRLNVNWLTGWLVGACFVVKIVFFSTLSPLFELHVIIWHFLFHDMFLCLCDWSWSCNLDGYAFLRTVLCSTYLMATKRIESKIDFNKWNKRTFLIWKMVFIYVYFLYVIHTYMLKCVYEVYIRYSIHKHALGESESWRKLKL